MKTVRPDGRTKLVIPPYQAGQDHQVNLNWRVRCTCIRWGWDGIHRMIKEVQLSQDMLLILWNVIKTHLEVIDYYYCIILTV